MRASSSPLSGEEEMENCLQSKPRLEIISATAGSAGCPLSGTLRTKQYWKELRFSKETEGYFCCSRASRLSQKDPPVFLYSYSISGEWENTDSLM